MDPISLFGIATALTIVGVSFLMGMKWLYSRHKARQLRLEPPQPTDLRIRVPR